MKYGDEFKVMGLAPYGEPDFVDADAASWFDSQPGGTFELDLSYFTHWSGGARMTWDEGEPVIDRVFSEKLERELGPARRHDEPVTPRHEAIAASLQVVFEEAAFHVLNGLHARTRQRATVPGRRLRHEQRGQREDSRAARRSTDVYIQPASGDNGTALGAAFYVWNQVLGRPRRFVMTHGYWGPSS